MKPIPVSFHFLGTPLVIHTYGIGLAITFWFAYRYFERKVRRAGLPWGWVTPLFLWVIVSAIVGARAAHVAANWTCPVAAPGGVCSAGPDYSQHLSDIFKIWNGGLSSFGGIVFAVPTGLLVARRRCPELGVWEALDLAAPVLMAAWALGRLLGPQLMRGGGGHPTNQWFGMYYADEVGKRLPVPIFQAFDSFVIWLLLTRIEKHLRSRPTGLLLAVTVGLWGLARFFEEFLWLSGGQGDSVFGEHLVEGTGLALFGAGVIAVAWLVRWGRSPDPFALAERRALISSRDPDISSVNSSSSGLDESPSGEKGVGPLPDELPTGPTNDDQAAVHPA